MRSKRPYRSYYKKLYSSFTLFCLFIIFLAGTAVSEELQQIRISTNPNLWFSQAAIIKGENWDKSIGLDLKLVSCPGPAQNLQLFVADQVEVMNNNAAAALLAQNRGLEIVILVSSFVGDIGLSARKELLDLKEKFGPVEAIRLESCQLKRPLILVTNPKGSLSDLMIRLWLKDLFPDFTDYLRLVHAGDQSQLQQLFLNRQADLVSDFAPLPTLFQKKDPSIGTFLSPDEIMTQQPGGVFVVRKDFTEKYPQQTKKLVELFKRASSFIQNNPEKAADHIDRFITHSLIERDVLTQSILRMKTHFSSDLSQTEPTFQRLSDFMFTSNYLQKRIVVKELLLK